MTGQTTQQRPLIFGEVLFDCFPDGSQVLGGAPFNVAWHLQAFGAAPLMISRIGEDALGQSIASAMLAWGMDSSGLQVDSEHPTGRVDISFSGSEHSFNIVDHSAYDYIDSAPLPLLPEDYLLYHGSLALRHDGSRQTLDYIRQLDGNPIFIDINLRSPWWQAEDISKMLEHATWMKLNEDELDIIIPGAQGLDERFEQLRQRYPAELFIITLGERGAIAMDRAGKQTSITPQVNQEVVDTVGAGDAFSSVLLLGILKEWPLATILERAQSFASAITGIRGATSTEQDFYAPFLRAWHL